MGGIPEPTSRAPPPMPKYSDGPVGKKIHNIYVQRMGMFDGNGPYAHEMLQGKMYYACSSGEPSVKLSVWSAPNLERPTFKEATSKNNTYKPTHTGASFGPSWSTHWFEVKITVPEALQKHDHLEFMWDAGCEGMVWTTKGVPLQGLTGGGERVEWILPKEYKDGKEHTFYIEMACNKMFGNAQGDVNNPPSPDNYFELTRAEICAVNLDARGLHIDFWQIGDAAREFPENSWEEQLALKTNLKIMNHFIANDGSDEAIKECRKIAQDYIGSNVDSASIYDDKSKVMVHGVGHCHIDTCWLWPWAETKRKIARSWSNQCGLMDRYPEHRFVCSQGQQFKWLEELYPEVFDRVKAKVKTGQFVPIGGSWVEHDTNMPSGESLVRQFVYGQRFFESRFGERSKTFWLPDTFGYSPQIPQLSRLAEMPRFFTQKLSWNNINNFPHTTFNWVSIDGSQVLCHMTPAETYTAEAHFGDTMRCVTQHKSMEADPQSLLVFGKGDGGGGPTWEHIEKLRRQRGMNDKVGRIPRVGMGRTVDDFFEDLEKAAEKGQKFATWYGELYLELHRGTYTSQANNKRNNRKAEVMMHFIEYLATYASIKDVAGGEKGYKYPKEKIDEMWEGILLCQFHDCLPGSSIEMCYRDTDKLYAQIFTDGEKLISEAYHAFGFRKPSRLTAPEDLYMINPHSFSRNELLTSPDSKSTYKLCSQSNGLIRAKPTTDDGPSVSVHQQSNDTYILENDILKLTLNRGAITSLCDKRVKREIIPSGTRANQLVLYDDKPLYWQAWDVEVYHLDVRKELYPHTTSITSAEKSHVTICTETRISEKSNIKCYITLHSTSFAHGGSLISTSAEINWHESHKFLKVETPVDIINTSASYETAFGLIQRPTHYNTSWDMARFEVICHKYADLSEANYGVSILNESKYGFATAGNVLRLSLLRAPKSPDGHADMGCHFVRWGILPHLGPLGKETVQAGIAFNAPMHGDGSSHHRAEGMLSTASSTIPSSLSEKQETENATNLALSNLQNSTLYTHPSPARISKQIGWLSLRNKGSEGVILSNIKRGEDDIDIQRSSERGRLTLRKGRSVIVRLYESIGGRSTPCLSWLASVNVKKVTKCNLLEDDGDEVEIRKMDRGEEEDESEEMDEDDRNGVEFVVKPFEVVTLRVWL